MGRNSFNGGGTVVGPRSGWFSHNPRNDPPPKAGKKGAKKGKYQRKDGISSVTYKDGDPIAMLNTRISELTRSIDSHKRTIAASEASIGRSRKEIDKGDLEIARLKLIIQRLQEDHKPRVK